MNECRPCLGVRHATAVALILCAQSALAQEVDGGLAAALSVTTGVTASDIEGIALSSEIGFGLSSKTRTQAIDLSSRYGLDLEEGSSLDIIDSLLALSYSVEGRQTLLSADLSHRRAEVDDFIVNDDDPARPGLLIFDDGLREDVSVTVGMQFGREAKFGGGLVVTHSRTNYSGTTEDELVGTVRQSADLSLRFVIDPTVTATLDYLYATTDRDGGSDTERDRLSVGADVSITPTLDASLSVGLGRVETLDRGVVSVSEGLTYRVSLEQAQRNGALTMLAFSEFSQTGRRTTAQVGRTLDTPRGALTASLGLSIGENDEIRPILALSYLEEMPRGRYTIAVDHNFQSTSDADQALNTQLRIGWDRDLTQTSRFGADLTYRSTDILGKDEDRQRYQLGVRYSRDLTEDWALATSFNHIVRRQDGAETERENTLFVGLETSYGWRP